jgi:hypothetical protein
MEATHCPVCGFGPLGYDPPISLRDLAWSWDICPCCFCEYGFDDCTVHRETWIAEGASWKHGTKPEGWDLEKQLINAIEGWEQFWGQHCPTSEKRAEYTKAIDLYLAQLHDPIPRRRFSAIRILETLEDSRIEPALESALHDADEDVREVARFALCRRKGESPFDSKKS